MCSYSGINRINRAKKAFFSNKMNKLDEELTLVKKKVDASKNAQELLKKKKKSEETKIEALQKKLEFARKQRQVHDDAASDYREKASKIREKNPDDRAADNYDMKADKQEEMGMNQNDKVADLKDAIKKLNKVSDIGFIELSEKDVVRHDLVKKIINAYEKYKS